MPSSACSTGTSTRSSTRSSPATRQRRWRPPADGCGGGDGGRRALDAEALSVARANLARHAPRVRLVRGDLLAPFRAGAFDLVVANPPYVAEAELAGLAPEVRDHEPRAALAAGPDGLAALRALI